MAGSHRIVRASKKHRCLVCDGTGWPCYYLENREVAGCKNVPGDRRDRDGLHLHILVARHNPVRDSRPRPAPKVERRKARPAIAPPDRLHSVYSALLTHRGLLGERRENLLARGLTPESIEAGGYRDTPTREEAEQLVRLLEPYGLSGVPGFYRRDGRWRMLGCYPGTFVPYRGAAGRIRGLSYRLDVPVEKTKYLWLSTDPEVTFDDGRQKFPQGAKLTPPLHFARPDLIASSPDILLTEGSLKGDVAASLLGLPFICAGGVTQWGEDFAERFKRKFPDKRAVICYDADWRTKREVRHALERLMASLRDARVPYVVRSWPDYPEAKGIDDLALLLTRKEVLAA